MKKIETRIETMQLELVKANKISTNCLSGCIFMNVLGGSLDAYPSPEDALTKNGETIRDILNDLQPSCDGTHFFRVSVVVDLFARDYDDGLLSMCDFDEIERAIEEHEQMAEEPIPPMFWHSLESGFPHDNVTVLVATDKNIFFFARYHKDKNIWVNEHGDVDYTDAGVPKYWAELPTIKTK